MFLAALALTLGGTVLCGPVHAAGAEEGEPCRVTIPAGSLEDALTAFGTQCGLNLDFDAAALAGRGVAGLNGTFAVVEGLALLLEGTGLRAEVEASGRVTLVARSTTAEEETVLPKMTVQGEPIGTHEIPVEKIKRSMAKDMADVFENDPSVIVGGGARNAQRVYVRGVDAVNLNVTIDGAKQGGSLHQHRGDIGAIDPMLLKRVAVQTGSSADAGPGALGGSIRFETVDAQDLLEPGESLGAMVTGGFASADESWTGGGSAYGVFDENFGLLAHFSATDRDDYTVGGGGEAPNTAGEDYDYFMKFSMLERQGHSLRLSAENKRDSGLYVWGSDGSDMGYAASGVDPVYVSTERTSLVFDHRYHENNPLLDTRVNAYYTQNSVDNEDGDSEYAANVLGYDLRNTFHLALGDVLLDLTAGGDGVAEENTAEVSGDDTSNDSHNLGFYIQNRLSYGPARLSFGARLDAYRAEFGEGTIQGSRVSPSVGLEYDLLEDLTAFAGYGQAVRASGTLPGSWMANIDGATKFDVDAPETSQRYEGGLRYRKAGVFRPDGQLNLEGSVFQSRLKNVITAVGGKGGVVKQILNSDPLISKGWEARAGWGFEPFETSLAYTHVITRDANDEPVSVTRRLVAASGDRLTWDSRFRPLESLTLGYTMSYVAELTDVPDGTEDRPGYVLHSVQAEWRPQWVPGLALNLAVHNLADRRYSEQTSILDSNGDALLEPGRDIRLGLTYRF
ncbi:MAG: TonB-dependent receptor [Desulfovibrionaceae bacterium]|jgi:hemoglobin/transferrin/lactoferrin receptor protein|nr:TonB-dependent receptor [Desulfovibrionaceae bacterium]